MGVDPYHFRLSVDAPNAPWMSDGLGSSSLSQEATTVMPPMEDKAESVVVATAIERPLVAIGLCW